MTDTSQTNEELRQEVDVLRQRVNKLEAAEERFFNLFEYAGDAIFIVDPADFRIIDANAAAARRLGYTHEELLQLTLDDLEVLEYHDFPGMVAWESTYSGTRVYECHYRRKDGFRLPVEVSSRMVEVGDQKVLQNVMRDITKRKQVEAELKEAHDRLLILRNVDQELSQKLDVQYVITRALDAAVRLSHADTGIIGLVEGEKVRLVHGAGPYQDQIGTELPQDWGIIKRVLANRTPELIHNVNADPNYVPRIPTTRAQMTLPLMAQERVLGVLNLETQQPDRFTAETYDFIKLLGSRIALALDNAETYETQAHLVEDLDAFAHTVAHDLKSPLNTMLGYASLLAHEFDTFEPDQAQEFLLSILRSGKKMTNIIEELLLLASVRKLDEIETHPLHMPSIIIGAMDRLESLIQQYEATIVTPEPDGWPNTVGYSPWVEEVWTNYISNAIKYGGTPPVVELGATAHADGTICYWVKDNGEGIPAEKQAVLFNQFTRLDETRAQGHGLGLSIVQRIVHKLGGTVSFESKPGAGSVFQFCLPRFMG